MAAYSFGKKSVKLRLCCNLTFRAWQLNLSLFECSLKENDFEFSVQSFIFFFTAISYLTFIFGWKSWYAEFLPLNIYTTSKKWDQPNNISKSHKRPLFINEISWSWILTPASQRGQKKHLLIFQMNGKWLSTDFMSVGNHLK